jgi:hypothetical protein
VSEQPLFVQTVPPPHFVPHVPQLALSVAVFAQYAAPASGVHIVSAPHVRTQWPLWHSVPLPHFVPHVPQFTLSEAVFAQYAAPASGVHAVNEPHESAASGTVDVSGAVLLSVAWDASDASAATLVSALEASDASGATLLSTGVDVSGAVLLSVGVTDVSGAVLVSPSTTLVSLCRTLVSGVVPDVASFEPVAASPPVVPVESSPPPHAPTGAMARRHSAKANGVRDRLIGASPVPEVYA